MRNTPRCRAKCRWHPNKGEAHAPMWSIVVIRRQQRQQTVGVVGAWCRHSWDCGRLHWHTGWSSSTPIVGILASSISPMRARLYGFLGSIWGSSAKQTASGGWKRNRQNQLHRTIQQDLEATGISASPKNLVFFQIIGESHWCYLVFCALLQRIITCLALPNYPNETLLSNKECATNHQHEFPS